MALAVQEPQAKVMTRTDKHEQPHSHWNDERHIHQITHDLNNCLMVLTIHCDQLMNDLSTVPEYVRKIQLLQDNLQLAAGIVQEIAEPVTHSNAGLRVTYDEFFTFLVSQQTFFQLVVGDDVDISLENKITQLPDYTADAIFMSERQVIPPALEPVERISFHPHRLRRVLMQLLRNAAEAMNMLGYASCTESADSRKLPKITLTLSRNSDDEVWLNVIDNGPGISNDNFSQILQSGFSTKAGHNRGHGLPAAAMLANSWGGILEVVDPVDTDGAHFRIKFPNC
jgi:signal transduction histidine kinase